MILVRTKIGIPPAAEGTVERPRLLALLGASRRVVLVAAPAGYGKSTLLASWARSRGGNAGWLSVDEGDDDPSRLLAYLAAAIGAHDQAPGTLEEPVAVLVDLLAARSPFLLVIDDAHLIRSRASLGLLRSLLERLPERVTVAMAVRSRPDLPWERLRSRGDLTELTAEDLRFEPEESAAVLAAAGGPLLDADGAGLLDSRLEGWAAGVSLAARALASREAGGGRTGTLAFLRDARAAHRWALDYLLQEVLERRPREDEELLLRTSVLERVSAPLASAVSDGPDAGGRFRALVRDGLFLLPADSRGEWFRYHALFAELLRTRLRERLPGLEPELRRRAAAWLEAAGLDEEAASQYLASGDAARAADFVERAAESVLARGDVMTFLGWMERLPREQTARRPGLALRRAFCLYLQGRPTAEVQSSLDEAASHASGDRGEGAAIRALALMYRGDPGGAAAQAEEVARGGGILASFARLIQAAGRREEGHEADAMRLLEEVAGSGTVFAASIALTFLASLEGRLGSLGRARVYLERALRLATDQDGRYLPAAGRALVGLGEIALERDELDAAERTFRAALSLLERSVRAAAMAVFLSLARLHLARGEIDDAASLVERARERAREFDLTEEDDRYVELVAARVALAKGEVSEARRFLDGLPPYAVGELRSRHTAKYEATARARLLLAVGRAGAALAMLDETREVAASIPRPLLLVEIDLLRAACLLAARRRDGAVEAVSTALATASQEGLVRLCREAPPATTALIAEIAGTLPEPSASLARRLGSRDDAAGTEGGERLTRRELEVLRYLRSDLTASEIAERLFVSEHTIKSHLKAVYGKLGVRGRPGAVARAEELGLLPRA